jgi:predicted nucleic-acid-binding Zn-ribbon protein
MSVVILEWLIVRCSKCGSEMREDRHLQALGCSVDLVTKEAFLGDKVKTYYCQSCGYIELYRVSERP